MLRVMENISQIYHVTYLECSFCLDNQGMWLKIVIDENRDESSPLVFNINHDTEPKSHEGAYDITKMNHPTPAEEVCQIHNRIFRHLFLLRHTLSFELMLSC